jgi:superfamily II DNA/RNA helicase
VTHENIKQTVRVFDSPARKTPTLKRVIADLMGDPQSETESSEKIIVFLRLKRTCHDMANEYHELGYSCDGLHGDREQHERTQIVKDFKSSTIRLLFATDVMARGIDIKDVTTVINFDFPQQVGAGGIEEYVHRIGRTGRAGAKGNAITFFTQEDSQSAVPFMALLKAAKQTIPAELQAMALRGQTANTDKSTLALAAKREAKKAQRKEKKAVREGDWTCPGCGKNCFARSFSCFKCSTPKP